MQIYDVMDSLSFFVLSEVSINIIKTTARPNTIFYLLNTTHIKKRDKNTKLRIGIKQEKMKNNFKKQINKQTCKKGNVIKCQAMSYTRYCSSGKLPIDLHKGLKKSMECTTSNTVVTKQMPRLAPTLKLRLHCCKLCSYL
jgi:hypothetical protein